MLCIGLSRESAPLDLDLDFGRDSWGYRSDRHPERYGAGDVIGCVADFARETVEYFRNGERLGDGEFCDLNSARCNVVHFGNFLGAFFSWRFPDYLDRSSR